MYLRVLTNSARNARPRRSRRESFESSHLEVRIFNAGHGEAIILIFDRGRAWLLDCGSNSKPRNKRLGELILDYLEAKDLVLETIIPSHPHFDHAGAIETILSSSSSHIASPVSIYRTDVDEWHSSSGWRSRYRDAVIAAGDAVIETALKDTHREVNISEGVEAHLFVGSGDGYYTSVFVQIRYRDARLLFTGDAYCGYEIELLDTFGQEDFRADVLKVTHHGSSSGTANKVLKKIQPGIAVASTGDDARHRLEQDTLARLGGRPGPRRVFETVVDGDIILRTDGRPYGGGVLYEAEFDSPGRFAGELGGEILSLQAVNLTRTQGQYPECEVCE